MGKPEYPMSIETFRNIGSYDLNQLRQYDISCFNGIVRVVKYRVTVEKIEEPKEVYTERLQKLWDESDNYHDYESLINKAKQFGIELTGMFGSKRKK